MTELTASQKSLADGLLSAGCIKFGEFTLKSGLKSPIYIDLRQIITYPKLLEQIGAAYLPLLKDLKFDRIAGLPYAAIPIATAISLESRDRAAVRAEGEAVLARPLLWISAGLVGVLVGFACLIAGWQVYKNGLPSTEVWAQIAGLIGFGTGVWVTIVGYRFGSSRGSSAKDVVIAELSARRN